MAESWMIRVRETGYPLLETFKQPSEYPPLKEHLEWVTAHQHLVELNTPGTRAYASRGDIT